MAKQLTVRGVDGPLERRLRAEARQRGLSINRTVLQLLRHAVGIEGGTPGSSRTSEAVRLTDLDRLAGTWSSKDAREFDEALATMRRIDGEQWQ
jgi:Arc/MetJ family transcription regulator